VASTRSCRAQCRGPAAPRLCVKCRLGQFLLQRS
jgi:hypothetical protein